MDTGNPALKLKDCLTNICMNHIFDNKSFRIILPLKKIGNPALNLFDIFS